MCNSFPLPQGKKTKAFISCLLIHVSRKNFYFFCCCQVFIFAFSPFITYIILCSSSFKLSLIFVLFLFIYLHPDCSSPSLLFSQFFPQPLAPPTPSPFLSKKEQASHGYQPKIVYEVAVRLGTSLSIKTTQYEEQCTRNKQRSQKQPLFSLLGLSQEDQDK